MEQVFHGEMPPVGMNPNEANSSGVCWAAIIGGAFAAAALSVTLLALGFGLGLSSVSPWSGQGASATTVGVATIIWLIIMQLTSSSLGGYLAGRLRTKWVRVHSDEVFFRDTAHGLFVWAVASVITASFMTSAGTSMVGGLAKAGTGAVGTASGAAAAVGTTMSHRAGEPARDSNAYFVDALFRSDKPDVSANINDSGVRTESGRILASALRQQDMSAADRMYLAQLVSARTGLSASVAQQRVDDILGQARKAADDAKKATDDARKTAAKLSLWIFLSLLIGAFCASYAATIGGRQRDHVVAA